MVDKFPPRKAYCVGRESMIGSEILCDLDCRVGHICHTYRSCGWLAVDELPKILEAVSNAAVARFVDKNHKLEGGVVTLSRNDLSNVEQILPLFYLYIFRPEHRHVAVVTQCLVRDHHVDSSCIRCRLVFRMRDVGAHS